MMPDKVLHILSQRPGRTGSGITLDSLVRQAAAAGHDQRALVGVPPEEERPEVGGLGQELVEKVVFGAADPTADLPFDLPGMSDVMPYPSTVWSTLTAGHLELYRKVWKHRIARLVEDFRPDIIHTNHVWLMSSLVPDAAPGVPAVCACHATGLRQMDLCPHLKDEVVRGCRRIERFAVLREDHRSRLAGVLGVDPGRIAVTGAGYREDLFRPGPESAREAGTLLYVGKYSEAKGLPWLLDALADLAPGVRLHVAGGGAGSEAERLRARMAAMPDRVTLHGMLDQPALADLMRRCAVCVLPSFYEGVPLVLVEAAACGCRIVATDLPGVRERIAPVLGPWATLVAPPRLAGVDRPVPEDLPAFTRRLAEALDRGLRRRPESRPDLDVFTWGAVFGRVAAVWRDLARRPGGAGDR
jgi:glycosyltransferase involved in cell wall biosynthesis